MLREVSNIRNTVALVGVLLIITAAGCTAPAPLPPVSSPARTVTSAPSSTPPASSADVTPRATGTGVASSQHPLGDGCSEDSGTGVRAPLATYGDTDTAELRFVGGVPPTARLCGSFESFGKHQEGSTASTSGSLAYLFSLVELGKVSTGGGYYWIGGAVDKAVGSVVISFAETPQTTTVTLVPLSTGWQGFAFEYSPGPFYYAPTGPGDTSPRNAGLTFTARDISGRPVDARYLNLDTNAQRKVSAPPTG